jgi:hypothetical protein
VTTAFSAGIPAGLPQHFGYDFLNADMLAALKADGAGEAVSPGGARYRAILLGGTSRYMTLSSLRRLKSLVAAGVPVIGEKPIRSPSLADEPSDFLREVDALWTSPQVIASSDVETAMVALGIAPDWQILTPTGSGLQFVHRILPDADIYFVSNPEDKEVNADLALRVTGVAPQIWNPRDGSVKLIAGRTEGAKTVVKLSLGGHDSRFIVFSRAAERPAEQQSEGHGEQGFQIATPWQVSFAGLAAPAPLSMTRLTGLERSADKAVRYFSGTISYKNSFKLPLGYKPGTSLLIDLGGYGDVAEVLVNGKSAGTVWFGGIACKSADLSTGG